MRLTLAPRSVRNPRERVTNRKLAMSAIILTRHVSLESCVLVITPLGVQNFVRYECTRGQRGCRKLFDQLLIESRLSKIGNGF